MNITIFFMPTWFVCLTYWFEGSRVCQFSTLTQHVNFVYTMKYCFVRKFGRDFFEKLNMSTAFICWRYCIVGSRGSKFGKNDSRCPLGSSVQCNYCFVGPRVCKLSTLTQDVNFVHTMKVLFCEETRMCSFLTKATCPLHLFFEGTVLWGWEWVRSQNDARCRLGPNWFKLST